MDLAVQRLVEYELECMERGRPSLWLLSALADGCAGFANMTTAQLEAELERRGLPATGDENIPEAAEDYSEGDAESVLAEAFGRVFPD